MKYQNFTLEENAADSLEEALNFLEQCNVNPRKIRLTILLLDNFLELFLKSYIYTTHPLLIQRKPSDKISQTITLGEAVLLIKKLGYDLAKPLITEIQLLRNLRNGLNHYQARLSILEWKEKIGKIIYYVLYFDEKNGNHFKIKALVSDSKWQEIIYLKDIFEKHKDSAIREAEDSSYFGPNDDPPSNLHPECPTCGIYGTTYIEEDRQNAYCYFCRTSFPINQCCYCSDYKYSKEYYYTECGIPADCCVMCAATI